MTAGNLGKPMKPPPQRAIRFVERLASTLAHTGTVGDPGHPDAGVAVKEIADRLEAEVAKGDLRGVFSAIDEALDDPAARSLQRRSGKRRGPRGTLGEESDPHYWG